MKNRNDKNKKVNKPKKRVGFSHKMTVISDDYDKK